MADTRVAVVTGSNKGIGLEICRQLAKNGINVILTARDEKKGIAAVEKLKAENCFSDQAISFHLLDVSIPDTIASLALFLKTRFGKLDILVNNAGVGGANVNVHVLKAQIAEAGAPTDISKIMSDTYEIVEECVTTNYYGVKRMCEAMIPLLQSSASPRIVTIASTMGKLENVSNEWAKGVLSDAENLTEEKIDEVMDEYLKDYRQGSLEAKGWPKVMSAYILSKAAVMALTRVLAKRNKSMIINSVCPGFVKTDINFNTGILSVEQGAASPVKLALVPNGDPSGLFYDRANVSNF
ncbi:PREDICTED: (+)-neomenthol dehydrogenase isoform X1 [Camelina sativa]|uniref:(+)-neomenthol dehydrogenase isoform X1 n=1 Tax=Camelina sativa TaxID=90675 RepID=A0ABM0WQP4_CAMSA|nr:PREDICTED: (+)-neomenthol dehydrogenase isoform X1 [Camelina sativa]